MTKEFWFRTHETLTVAQTAETIAAKTRWSTNSFLVKNKTYFCPHQNRNNSLDYVNLIHILLRPFLLHAKSYVKDNLDFLNKCSREDYEEALLVTFDVVNLYTNISQTFGLDVLNYWLENHPES